MKPITEAEEKKRQIIFGWGLCVITLVIGCVSAWKHGFVSRALVFWSISLSMAIITKSFPQALLVIYINWMKVAHKIGVLLTYLTLTLFYYVIITPIAILLKMMNKDYMQRKLQPQATSYWIKRDNSQKTAERYTKQF